jgi:hypothetical protein
MKDPSGFVWHADPALLALDASRRRRDQDDGTADQPFCLEVGRRLLLAQLTLSEWTLRRVEKVLLERDRSLSRTVTVEFNVRPEAPTFVGADGRRLRLVPLSMMRRRTLVNLDIRDEGGTAVPMPGIRLTQQLDEAVVLASIAAGHPRLAAQRACRDWVHRAISGTLPEVLAAYASLDQEPASTPEPVLNALRGDDLFLTTVNRFRTNFTLYIFVAEDADPDRRASYRLIRMSFDEPINWRYQTPQLWTERNHGGAWQYRPGRPVSWQLRRGLAALGFTPIRLRLQVPGAENAASYHFEMTAPPGVQIVEATLLAGRPGDRTRTHTVDRIVGHAPTVGLHGLEVPHGSLCRVQVDLRAAARGWLITMLIACVAICAVLGTVAMPWLHDNPGWKQEEIVNLVLVLVTTAAGVTTLVAQRDNGDVAARFVTGARVLGTLATVLPLAVAGLLVYAALPAASVGPGTERWLVLGLCATSVIPLIAVAVASAGSIMADRRQAREESPWDMTDHERARSREVSAIPEKPDFYSYVTFFGFDTPAVGVQSAEGWRQFYSWDSGRQRAAVEALTPQAWPFPACAVLGDDCPCSAGHSPRRITRWPVPRRGGP